jgi:hypothetical protein
VVSGVWDIMKFILGKLVCDGVGERGRRIRELTSVIQKRFKFPENGVELYAEKVNNRGLCAIAQAESLRYKLLGGLAVRRYVTLFVFLYVMAHSMMHTVAEAELFITGVNNIRFKKIDRKLSHLSYLIR